MKRLALLLLCAAAPAGTDLTSPESKWWECQHNREGGSCCSLSDGRVVQPEDWRQDDNHYFVRIEGRWWQIPDEALVSGGGECGPEPNEETRPLAKVWYYLRRGADNAIENIHFYCAMSGILW